MTALIAFNSVNHCYTGSERTFLLIGYSIIALIALGTLIRMIWAARKLRRLYERQWRVLGKITLNSEYGRIGNERER